MADALAEKQGQPLADEDDPVEQPDLLQFPAPDRANRMKQHDPAGKQQDILQEHDQGPNQALAGMIGQPLEIIEK